MELRITYLILLGLLLSSCKVNGAVNRESLQGAIGAPTRNGEVNASPLSSHENSVVQSLQDLVPSASSGATSSPRPPIEIRNALRRYALPSTSVFQRFTDFMAIRDYLRENLKDMEDDEFRWIYFYIAEGTMFRNFDDLDRGQQSEWLEASKEIGMGAFGDRAQEMGLFGRLTKEDFSVNDENTSLPPEPSPEDTVTFDEPIELPGGHT